MKVAIYGRTANENIFQHALEVIKELNKYNASVILHKPLFDFIKENSSEEIKCDDFSEHHEIRGEVDYMISIGGDGTLLETITLVQNSGIPILGINTGRLGFLAGVAKEDISLAITDLVKKKFSLDKRTLLRLASTTNLFGEINYALNEFTIQKKDSSSMMTIHTFVNGEFLNSYWADGLIISTPTGSTAYSLSCGGPILVPESRNFIITPISPHNLNVRPMIIPDDSLITVKVEGRSTSYLASLDSRSEVFGESEEFTVSKEDFRVNLVKLSDQHFFTTIRNKLMWGHDKRN